MVPYLEDWRGRVGCEEKVSVGNAVVAVANVLGPAKKEGKKETSQKK